MRKGLGRLFLLTLALTVLLTACAQETETGFDAEAYVTGVLKATYLGQFQADYLEMVGLTEAEAQTEYANGIHLEVNNFYSAYSIETTTDELHDGIEELFYDIYSHASLTVTGVEEREDGSFVVTVEVEPIDIVRQVHEALPALQAEFYAKYPEEDQNTMTSAQYTAFDAEWAQLVLGLYQDKLTTIGHLPAQTVTLRVEQDSQGYYGINNADFLALDKLVIDYTLPEPQPEETPTPSESPLPQESQEPQASPAPEEGDAVQTGGQPAESQEPQGTQPPASQEPQTSQPPESQTPQTSQPPESQAPQESVNPNDPTPPTTGTPVPGLEPE